MKASDITISRTRSEFLDSLFRPGKTSDGFIGRTLKSGAIQLTFRDENYVLNNDGVFCLASVTNGRKWYSYGGKLNELLSLSERDELKYKIRAMAAN